MSNQRDVLRGISWRELFPWLIIFRTFRLSVSGSILILATAGVLLTPVGWITAELVFLDDEIEDARLEEMAEFNGAFPGEEEFVPGDINFRVNHASNSVQTPYWRFVVPVRWLLGRDDSQPISQPRDRGWGVVAYLVGGTLWSIAVWSLLGGMITRIAVVRLGCEERLGLGNAFSFVRRRWLSYFAAPMFPLLAFALVLLFSVPLGWIMQTGFGVLLAGLIWFLVVIGGLLLAVVTLGLLFGWPLMWVTISAEEIGDVFEATQRSYSYTFERPLHYAFYALLALIYGILGWLLVYYFSESVLWFAEWAVAWGAGFDRMSGLGDQGMAGAGKSLIGFWEVVVRSIAYAFRYSYFWCAFAAIYLLLRRNVDQTEFDEILIDEDPGPQDLPALEEDEEGVPGVAEEDASDETAE